MLLPSTSQIARREVASCLDRPGRAKLLSFSPSFGPTAFTPSHGICSAARNRPEPSP